MIAVAAGVLIVGVLVLVAAVPVGVLFMLALGSRQP